MRPARRWKTGLVQSMSDFPWDCRPKKRSRKTSSLKRQPLLRLRIKRCFDEAAALFAKSRKPVLAVGLGAVRAAVQEQIRLLAEKHQIPVVLTPMAKGMLREDHPCYAGVVFHALSDMVGQTHAQADLVIGIGYDPVEFNYESWMPKAAPLVSFDVAPADIDTSNYTLAVDAVGDIGRSLESLLALPAGRKDWDLSALAGPPLGDVRQIGALLIGLRTQSGAYDIA
jgi:thiamine pyrophosphate-dependent acetolactate synthase large subunit-like protein